MHTTNYFNSFIEVAEDCPINEGQIPPIKGNKKTVANLQFDMIEKHPYEYTSDEVLFAVYATRKEIPSTELEAARQEYFSKGQPCFRASPLTKRYGWGIHSNEEGKIALYSLGSKEYNAFLKDSAIAKTKAMRSSRKNK